MPGPAAAAVGAGKLAGIAWKERHSLPWLLLLLFGLPIAFIALLAAMLGGFGATLTAPGAGITYAPSAFALRDIPPAYLTTYQQAGAQYAVGWEYLAAIGKIETDHGRLQAPGVTSGENFAGAGGPMQFLQATWDAYAVDGNGDGNKSRYDPEDAIPGAANYLKASGAPDDWPHAIFAYNHASWYVELVEDYAQRYRGAPLTPTGLPAGSSESQALPVGKPWLAPVPGTNAVCDRRIVPDVVMLMQRYKMTAGDCFALEGHKGAGEHPLGLGIDLYPAADGSWQLLGQLARDLGWTDSCAYTGCAGQLPSPFRFIGWNGYSDGHHGDPDHVGTWAHLHLSWQHTPALPGTPAARVQTLLAPDTPSEAATPTKPATPAPSSSTPAARSLLSLGDSLAEGTARPLASTLDGWTVRTEAVTSRSSSAGVNRLEQLADAGPLPSVVAVSLGTNDDPSAASAFARSIARALALTGPRRCVLWLSVDRPPVNGVSYARFNDALHAAAASHPNLQILDGRVGQSAPDGVHKTPAGYTTRAQLIATAARDCKP